MNEGILLHAFQYYKMLSCHVILHLKNKQVNLQINEVVILETLYCFGALSQQELANILGLDKSSVQRSVVNLYKKGMLQISSDLNDKRKNILRLAADGSLVITEVAQKLKQIMPQSPELNLQGVVFPL